MHGIGMMRPRLKLVLVGRELLLERLDVLGVFIEEDLGTQLAQHPDIYPIN
jgi:hypothetical protein